MLLHSFSDGHFSCFQFLATMRMLQWTWVYKCVFESLLSIIWGISPEVELLDYMIILIFFFKFWGKPTYCLPWWLHYFTFSETVHRLTSSPHLCQSLLFSVCVHVWGFCLFVCFYSSHLNECEMVSYCVFDFHFPNDVILKHLFVLIGHIYIFGEIHIHIFCPFLVVFCGYLKFYIYFGC